MTVSKGIVDVDSQRNIAAGWHSKTWTFQCLCLHPWSTSIINHQVPCCHAAGVREETLTLIETIHLPRVWQLGSINSTSPWGSRGFEHDWILKGAATSHIQPPNTPWCTESTSRTSWRRLERLWKGWFAVAAAVCLYKLMIPTTSVRHSVGLRLNHRSLTLFHDYSAWDVFRIEYACCMFVFSYLAQTFCLFGMALI